MMHNRKAGYFIYFTLYFYCGQIKAFTIGQTCCSDERNKNVFRAQDRKHPEDRYSEYQDINMR